MCQEQHGFGKERSCESQPLELVDKASEALEKGCQEDLIVLVISEGI